MTGMTGVTGTRGKPRPANDDGNPVETEATGEAYSSGPSSRFAHAPCTESSLVGWNTPASTSR